MTSSKETRFETRFLAFLAVLTLVATPALATVSFSGPSAGAGWSFAHFVDLFVSWFDSGAGADSDSRFASKDDGTTGGSGGTTGGTECTDETGATVTCEETGSGGGTTGSTAGSDPNGG